MQGIVIAPGLNKNFTAQYDMALLGITGGYEPSEPIDVTGVIENNEIDIIVDGVPIDNRPIPISIPRIIKMPVELVMQTGSYIAIRQRAETTGLAKLRDWRKRFALHFYQYPGSVEKSNKYSPYFLCWRHEITDDQRRSDVKAELPGADSFEVYEMYSVVYEIFDNEGEQNIRRIVTPNEVLCNIRDNASNVYANIPLPVGHYFPDFTVSGAVGGLVREKFHPAIAPIETGKTIFSSVDWMDAAIADDSIRIYQYLVALGVKRGV